MDEKMDAEKSNKNQETGSIRPANKEPVATKPDDSKSEVWQALADLHAGDRTLDDVAQAFAVRTWPVALDQTFVSATAKAELLPPVGSFAEVETAWVTDLITDEQYERLYKAVTEQPTTV